MTAEDDLLFDLCMAMRKVPPATLRDLGKRRLPGDELAEKIVAEKILAHLERAGLELKGKSARADGHRTPLGAA